LADEANAMGYDAFVIASELATKFTEAHKEPLDLFGRFPTRNECLGRENTPEEEEWLQNEDKSCAPPAARLSQLGLSDCSQ